MKNLIFFAGVIGAILFVSASIIGGAQIEGYDIVSQFISESYAAGLPNVNFLRYMYITCGILFAFFGFGVPTFLPKSKGIKIGFFLFSIFYGFGTVITGFFPCDFGCPESIDGVSFSQFVHNTAGFLTYVITPFCLISIGLSAKNFMKTTSYPNTSVVCGCIALVFVVILFNNPTGPYIGLFQRLIEASFLFWVMYTSFVIRR